jgi:hypothetical protein
VLIIECRPTSRSEKNVLKEIASLEGVVVVGFLAETNTQEREIDLLLMTPVRATVIEVKAQPIEKTRGILRAYVNKPWTVDGKPVSFFGNVLPHVQARTGAQVFSSFLKYRGMGQTPFIQSAVAVSSSNVIIQKPRMVGQTAVFNSLDSVAGLDLMRKKPVELDIVMAIIEAMGLDHVDDKALKNEWRNFSELTANLATTTSRREKKEEIILAPSKTIKILFADNLALFIAVFLFVFFAYVMIHAVIHR